MKYSSNVVFADKRSYKDRYQVYEGLSQPFGTKMKSSFTCTLTGTTSHLQCSFCPEIILDGEYSCALLDFSIANTSGVSIDLSEIRIECDIISDSYINGEQSHIIHQCMHKSLPDKRNLVETPNELNFFPVKVKRLQTIHISIVDKNGNLVDSKNSYIICRIAIKRDQQ